MDSKDVAHAAHASDPWVLDGCPTRMTDCLLGSRSGRLLVQTEHVPGGIAESRRHLARITADGLHDLPSVRNDGLARCGNAVTMM